YDLPLLHSFPTLRSSDLIIELNSNFGIQNIPTYSLLETQQFIDLAHEMYANSNNPDVNIEEDLYGRLEPFEANRLTSFNPQFDPDRKSTRLNSSHVKISY